MRLIRASKDIKPKNGVCLITGDGRTCPHDIHKFLEWNIKHDVITIGRSVMLYPGNIDHWANVDGADSKWWAEHLPPKNNGEIPTRHTIGEMDWYDVIWDDGKPDGTPWQGSSALFATLIALEMGYEKVVLAGCPLDEEGHWYFDPKDKGPIWEGGTYRAWLDFADTPEAKRVSSLSGYTRKILEQGNL